MSEPNWAVVDATVEDCARELFETYGLDVGRVDGPMGPLQGEGYLAVLGFSGDEFRGTLAISAAFETIRSTNIISASPTESMDRDWIGELSNQMLGRIKNKLLKFGATIQLSTPMVFTGRNIRSRCAGAKDCRTVSFDSPRGSIVVWMEGEFQPGFELEEQLELVDVSEEEGTFLFF